MRLLEPNEQTLRTIDTLIRIFDVMNQLDIELDLWEFQNEYFRKGSRYNRDYFQTYFKEEQDAANWLKKFHEIGMHIQVKLPVFLAN